MTTTSSDVIFIGQIFNTKNIHNLETLIKEKLNDKNTIVKATSWNDIETFLITAFWKNNPHAKSFTGNLSDLGHVIKTKINPWLNSL